MATAVRLRNPQTGVVKKGFFGFSWTSLFFGGLPAIIRGDIGTGLAVMLVTILTFGLAGVIWAFVYNKRYTHKLIETGYVIDDAPEVAAAARKSLGIVDAQNTSVAA